MAESIVALAAERIRLLLVKEADVLFEVEDEVQNLQKELQIMQQYLRDVDAKQQVREIHDLTGQIRSLAYDAEDIIDRYILKVEPKITENSYRNKFMKFACFLRHVHHIYEVRKQIHIIHGNVKGITGKLNGYGVIRSSSYDDRYSTGHLQRFPFENDPDQYIVGLRKDVSKLTEILLDEGEHRVDTISIVGTSGSGKTTLAEKLYNNLCSQKCFDCCAWVFISQKWNVKKVLCEILRKVDGHKETIKLNARSSKEELVVKLHDILEKRSCLVVLDGLGRKDVLEGILHSISRANSNRGTKIIITTRNQEVLELKSLQKRVYVHEAKPLCEEDAWELFSKIALYHHKDYNAERFENVGKKMWRKCDGLPLAIVALAGILRTKASIEEWEQVRETMLSRVTETTSSHMSGVVYDMLALSYDDLAYYLKPCFLYLGIFPEECQIKTGMLTRMWIAEGFVTTHREMSLEEVATGYLEELNHRFMIQVAKANVMGEVKTIRLHDCFRDLCITKAKELSFLEVYSPDKRPDIDCTGVLPRRAALQSSVSVPAHSRHLRSLVFHTRSSTSHLAAYERKEALDLNVIPRNYKLLRVLNIWGIETVTRMLPSEIGSLIHLRYLGIRDTNITELPTSIGNLRNLLTFDYRNIVYHDDEPIKIPDVLWKLTQLRHLFLPVECPWSVEDLQLHPLENLQTLWGVKLNRTISELSRAVKKLKVVFISRQKGLAKLFSHHQHLQKLALIGEIEMHLPLLLPTNVVALELKDSMLMNVDPMFVLGALARLKVLRLSNAYQGSLFACEPASFPQLKELYLENLQNLETWRIAKGAFRCLEKLEIVNCRKLQDFPEGLSSISTLKRGEFFGMSTTFRKRAIEYGWSEQQWWLPHNYETLVKLCDSPVDTSSMHELYEQLIAGIFLDNRTKKYWVVEQDRYCYNCFMVNARGLSLVTELDRVDDLWEVDGDCWEWSQIIERDGTAAEVAKLSALDARLSMLGESLLKVRGKLNAAYLSPNVRYKISYMIMLDDAFSWEEVAVKSTIVFPDGEIQSQHTKLKDEPTNEWIRVSGCEFNVSAEKTYSYEEVKFSLKMDLQGKKGIAIKGVLIEPKL